MNPLLFFWLLLKGSLFSFSGMGNVPILHDEFLRRGWTTESQFAESLAIGQIAPGPNGLWVLTLAYLIDGFAGAALALLSICLPPFLILAVNRLYQKINDHPAVDGFVRGLSISMAGIFAVVLIALLKPVGVSALTLGIGAVAAAVAWRGKVPVFAILASGAAAGMVLYR